MRYRNELFNLPAIRASRHASIKSDFISGFSFPIDSPREEKQKNISH
jgi:hypothetical protein